MRRWVLVIAVLATSPAVFAQGARTAPMMVSARVEPSCAIDVQAVGRLRLTCGTDTLRHARVSVNGLPAVALSAIAAPYQEQLFLLPASAATLASTQPLPALERTPSDLVLTIEF